MGVGAVKFQELRIVLFPNQLQPQRGACVSAETQEAAVLAWWGINQENKSSLWGQQQQVLAHGQLLWSIMDAAMRQAQMGAQGHRGGGLMAPPGTLIPALQTERRDQQEEKGFIYQPTEASVHRCALESFCALQSSRTPCPLHPPPPRSASMSMALKAI